MVTGLLVICFCRRKNRISYLVSVENCFSTIILLTYWIIWLEKLLSREGRLSFPFLIFKLFLESIIKSLLWSMPDKRKSWCFPQRINQIYINNFLKLFFQIKLGGCCCLCSAVLCVVVTVTTTVLHMNRLQVWFW